MFTVIFGMVGFLVLVALVGVVVFMVFIQVSRRPRKLPSMPAFGQLPVKDARLYLGRHLAAHGHMFPSETPIVWEAVRGWNVNEQPPDLSQPGPVSQIVLTDRLIHFCGSRGGMLHCLFDFLLHMIVSVEFDESAAAAAAGLPPGTVLMSIVTPSGRTPVLCSRRLAGTLPNVVQEAKRWAQQKGMEIAQAQ